MNYRHLLHVLIVASSLTFQCSLRAAEVSIPSTATPHGVDPAVVRELVGKWTNILRSTLVIKNIDPATGKIDGSYVSPEGTGGIAYPLVGWVNTKAPKGNFPVVSIAWTVRWGSIGSITSWSGFYAALPQTGAPKTPTIVGNWLLTRPDGDFEWDHVLSGQDRFTKAE